MSNIVPANMAVKALGAYLEAPPILERFLKILPPSITPQKFVSQALVLANNNPGLADCSHQSIYVGMMQAAELGLELSGVLGHAYLVPRSLKGRRVATFQVGYRGLMHLAYRSDRVSNFQLRSVRREDEFSVEYGDYPRLKHKPVLFDRDGAPEPPEGERGGPDDVIAYYCLVNLVDGGKDFEVLTWQQALKHRDRFASTKSGGPWYDMQHGFHEMALKTVARHLCKRLPISVSLVKAAVLDEYHEAGILEHNVLPVSNTARTEELANRLLPEEPPADAEFEGGPDPLHDERPQAVS